MKTRNLVFLNYRGDNMNYETVTLETNNLVIKKGTSKDCIKIYEYDMVKCRGIAGEDILVKSDREVDFIGGNVKNYYNSLKEEKIYDWYVYLKPNLDPIANIIADRQVDEIKAIELAYNMHPDYWRKGYMTEALKAVMNHLFSIGYENIIMGYDEGNIKSKNFINKLGLTDYMTIENQYQKNGVNINTYEKIINKKNL